MKVASTNGNDHINIAVFLDRDGVINKDPPHYAHRLDQLEIISRSDEAVRILNLHSIKVIVISNQSGVARGYYSKKAVEIFNQGIREKLATIEAHLDAFYYCTHHPESDNLRYKKNCNCRKPKPGMLFQAAKKYNLNLSASFLVGDKWTDIEAGHAAGCRSILVLTGHGADEFREKQGSAEYIAADLYDAVINYIIPNLS